MTDINLLLEQTTKKRVESACYNKAHGEASAAINAIRGLCAGAMTQEIDAMLTQLLAAAAAARAKTLRAHVADRVEQAVLNAVSGALADAEES